MSTTSTDTYQGHLGDGSSVQKHSAGGMYPYILFGQQAGDTLLWGIQAPTGARHLFKLHANAVAFGAGCKLYDAAKTQSAKHIALDAIMAAKNADTLARLAWR